MFGAALFWIAGILFELPRDRNKNFQKVLTFGLLQDIIKHRAYALPHSVISFLVRLSDKERRFF